MIERQRMRLPTRRNNGPRVARIGNKQTVVFRVDSDNSCTTGGVILEVGIWRKN